MESRDDDRLFRIVEEIFDTMSAVQNKHATEIGKVAIAWNDLQLKFGQAFSNITEGNYRQSQAIWHAVLNDRAQREMLTAAAQNVRDKPLNTEAVLTELIWAVNQATALEDNRNTALHAPYRFGHSEFEIVMEAASESGHARALKLEDKDVSLELQTYAENIRALVSYVGRLNEVLGSTAALPQKPRMRRVAQAMTRKAQRPQNTSK